MTVPFSRFLEGRVEKVHNGSVTVDVETSTNLGSIPLGFQEIPIDRLSTVRWRQRSKYRVILTTVAFWEDWSRGFGSACQRIRSIGAEETLSR